MACLLIAYFSFNLGCAIASQSYVPGSLMDWVLALSFGLPLLILGLILDFFGIVEDED
jgi:hypothetical protein